MSTQQKNTAAAEQDIYSRLRQYSETSTKEIHVELALQGDAYNKFFVLFWEPSYRSYGQ